MAIPAIMVGVAYTVAHDITDRGVKTVRLFLLGSGFGGGRFVRRRGLPVGFAR